MKSKQNTQRFIALVLCLLLSGSIAAIGSFAWFQGRDEETNRFKSKELVFDVRAVDIFTRPGSIEAGVTTNKTVGAKNQSTMPAFVRLLVAVSLVSPSGQPLEALPGKQITFVGLNTTDWVYGEDGYYYYLHTLGPAGSSTNTTPPLFTGVMLTYEAGEEYRYANLDIVIKTEAVDTMGFNYRTAWWGNEDAPQKQVLLAVDTALQTAQK